MVNYIYKLEILYLYGKKDYSYAIKAARTNFKGRFYGVFPLGDDKMEEKYRKKKAEALENTQKDPMSAGQAKYKDQRDLFIYLLRKYMKLPYQQLENLISDYGLAISYVQLQRICSKFGDYGTPEPKIDAFEEKTDEISLNEPNLG